MDLLTGFITIRETKHNKGRSVPITTELGSWRRHLDDAGEWVFDPRPTQADFFAKAVLRAQETLRDARKDTTMGFTWHGRRHSWASRLTMAGVAPRTLQVLGGWKTLAMVERYSHLGPGHLQDAVEKLAHGAAHQVGKSVERRTVKGDRNFQGSRAPAWRRSTGKLGVPARAESYLDRPARDSL